MRKSVVIKKIAKSLLPSKLYGILRDVVYRPNADPEGWKRYRKDPLMPAELIEMFDAYESHSGTNATSKFWIALNNAHIRRLLENGYENFRQTIAIDYFTWLVEKDDPQMQFLLQHLPEEKIALVKRLARSAPKHPYFTPEQSLRYNTITLLLWEYAQQQEAGPELEQLGEPGEGNPPFVKMGKKWISEDLLNSVLEFKSVSEGCDLSRMQTVMELGAGYGRDAYVFLKLMPHLRYLIVDIPPALYISQRYLSNQFPDRRVFKWRVFKSYSDVEKELNSSSIVFLMPWQLTLLPEKVVDLCMAIDSLHEMRHDQIEDYFHIIDRLTRNNFYFKCWKTSINRIDGLTVQENSYPVRPQWRKIFWRDCRVQTAYFEALYAL